MPNTENTHIYVEKIKHLEIDDKIKIGEVTFMNFEKFKRIKNWNSKNISQKLGEEYLEKWWDNCKAVAVLPYSGDFKEKRPILNYKVQESLEILAFSAYPFNSNTETFQLGEMNNWSISNAVSINLANKNSYFNKSKLNGAISFKINQSWLTDAKEFKYFELLKLINSLPNPKILADYWANNIKEVCKIIGRTNISSDFKNGFLMCVIALEMLLLNKNDRQKSNPLIQRLEAFFGWQNNWKDEEWHIKIKTLYTKRNEIVHAGNFKNVYLEDYLFARELCFNLIYNIINHQKHFIDKDALILFTEKTKAEKLLGLKNKVKPISLKYISQTIEILPTESINFSNHLIK